MADLMLPQFRQMNLERLRIVLKPKIDHRIQNIFPAYRLPFLQLAFLCRLGCDEADELGHALLYTFFRVFRDFGGRGYGGFHYTRDICYG